MYEISVADPGWGKMRIRDNHPGSATLRGWKNFD